MSTYKNDFTENKAL